MCGYVISCDMLHCSCDVVEDICNAGCQNGGTCIPMPLTGTTPERKRCVCADGYTGENCEVDIGMLITNGEYIYLFVDNLNICRTYLL